MKPKSEGYVTPQAASSAFRSKSENGAEAARKKMIERQMKRGRGEKKDGNTR